MSSRRTVWGHNASAIAVVKLSACPPGTFASPTPAPQFRKWHLGHRNQNLTLGFANTFNDVSQIVTTAAPPDENPSEALIDD